MSESYAEFTEVDGSVRMAGGLQFPQATPSDVLTVQDDGTIAAAAGGGSSPFTGSFTTDADTFTVSAVVDTSLLSGAYLLSAQLTGTVADGETFGDAGLDVALSLDSFQTSQDNLSYSSLSEIGNAPLVADSNGYLSTVGQQQLGFYVGQRYVRVNASIVVGTTGLTYAGSNHPTATFLVTLRPAVEAAT